MCQAILRRYRKAMCPTCYMDQSENGGETAKALTNPPGSQTKNRSDESHFWLFHIVWKYTLVTVLFLVFLISAVIVLVVVSSRPCPNHAASTCPVNWIGSQGRTYPWKCYYFSQVDGDWNSSQRNCSSLGASLATVDTWEEKEFMLHYKGHSETWIGLTREQVEKPWKWVNGTPFKNQFQIRGGGECAYLNDDKGVSSSRCSTGRRWVCSRPD
ncbi:C-type lectin domain family 2 member D-like isoform X2 [Gopherus evgoodei]|uniref:C-type lectin domain family 2 member D-like n=2 Tax=Gopherus evgoodei TaxID=1825980 RepID=A0A8C4W0S7_9SAUR|nr:C-type lectin domain family 2 member D-like isoform X2 [Gopherus evgoodei]XP_030399760.1 C-type lectin domain family 2 member D-like isoform X2 [Gopherus evgoodei]XP_030399761.1 C-type lectin domain family 2 member D-like isoform X2 [Gopherus evgoodei]